MHELCGETQQGETGCAFLKFGCFEGEGPGAREPRACPQEARIVAMACPQEARIVVVGADDSETSFAFDALVENDEGQPRTAGGGLARRGVGVVCGGPVPARAR